MSKYDRLKKQNAGVVEDITNTAGHFQEISDEYRRVDTIYKNSDIIINDIDREFASVTGLNSTDITFIFFAVALQCIRQYLLTSFKTQDERLNDKDAANKTRGHGKEYSSRKHRYYQPSFDEILTSPVPFDAIYGSKYFNLGFSGNNHRPKTLGHDPILGWIFGTANIATSTVTTSDFQSYHVKTGFTSNNAARDKITNHADTARVLSSLPQRGLDEGIAGKKILGLSVFKEAVHLQSDVNSKKSLPLPVVSAAFSPELAVKLGEYGLDTANVLTVGKQAEYSVLINLLISLIHGLLYDEFNDGSLSLYQVRTHKVLSWSNAIASGSNVIAVAVTEAIAVTTGNTDLAEKGLKYLDIGGLIVTCYRLLNDQKFIRQVKTEFLDNEWYKIVYGSEYDFMKESI